MVGMGRRMIEGVVKCPVSGCTLALDIVLRSCDQVFIGAHQANLARFSEGFPSSDEVTAPEKPIDLTETGEVLALLVHFMHKSRHPNLANIAKGKAPRKTLFALAEAAEKYAVYPAMCVCNLRIAEGMEDDLLDTFIYATKFDYLDIADRVAPQLIDMNATLIKRSLASAHSNVFLAWFRYREQFIEVADAMVDEPKELRSEAWRGVHDFVVSSLPKTTNGRLSLLKASVKKGGLPSFATEYLSKESTSWVGALVGAVCLPRVRAWEAECSQALAAVRPYSTFLGQDAALPGARH
ncbi:hypothetical protein FA13DRAFT_707099 [Coprinellus micaceus]|uniref:BTB domain-containing protein n=1 Tax=Coprinellus micaceus TaxID=71717 RepID=A0A4Y7TUB2_COPMI|nr:hypothetical protein FA13DRAFT_707099 [Coprinellus micaceus]